MLTIKGATNRRDYWIFKLINWAILLIGAVIWVGIVSADTTALTAWLFMLVSAALITFYVFYFIAKTSLLIRRFHDLNVNTETAVVIIIGKYLIGPIGLVLDLIIFIVTIFPKNTKPLGIHIMNWHKQKKAH